jgi:autotransporter-associated beta strand protein
MEIIAAPEGNPRRGAFWRDFCTVFIGGLPPLPGHNPAFLRDSRMNVAFPSPQPVANLPAPRRSRVVDIEISRRCSPPARRGTIQRRPLVAALALAAALAGGQSRADEIYGLGGDGPWQLGAANNRLAQTFTTGSLRMNLDSVSPFIRNSNGDSTSSTAGTLNMWLFATDGDRKPTNFLYTIATNFNVVQWYNQSPTFSNLSYTLNPNTTYAVVFQGSSGSTISWKYRNEGSISSSISPTPTFRDWASSDNGGSWGDGAPNVGYIMTANASNLATPFTWTGGGSSSSWSDTGNWSNGATPVSSGYAEIIFAGSSRTSNTNNLGNWRDVGRLEFASGAGAFTLGGDTFGFSPYAGNQEQQLVQNSAATQTIGVGAFSFRNAVNSRISLNAGDLAISSTDLYIDANSGAARQLYVTGDDQTRRTVTFSGNVNKGESGQDPDIVIQNNKRVLVTGSLRTGSGNDGAVFVNNGVLEFSGSGGMTGGSPVVGADSGSANAALLLGTAGATFSRQIEIKGGSSGQRIVGGTNTSGTVTFSSNFVTSNSPANYDLKAATGGTANFTGSRNFNAGLFVNRADGGNAYGGTVVLSGETNSNEFTALHGGTLQFGDFNRLGSSHFEFNADSGNSGTLRYTGDSTTITKALWIDNSGITRAAIDVSQAATTLTWNPGAGNVNQNLTKLGAGTLAFDAARLTGAATLVVEAGTLALSGTSTATGATTVAGGRLAVNGSLGNTAVTVQTGGELGGSGGIGGTVAVLAGGTLSPGNSIASLAAGTTTFAAASTYEYEYDSTNLASLGTAADLLVVSGGLTINSGALITFADLAGSPQAFIEDTTIFALINYSGEWNGGLFTYGSTALTDGGVFTVGGQQWRIDYDRTSAVGLDNFTTDYLPDSKFVAITAVPEPAIAGLVAAAGLALAGWRGFRGRWRLKPPRPLSLPSSGNARPA